MSDQRCSKCGGTLYSDQKYGCTALSCSKVLPDFHFDLTKPTQSTDTDTADYTPQQDCKTELDFVPWLIGTDDAPAPLPTDEQIAILLKEHEELRERLKGAAVQLHTGNFLWAIPTQ